MRRRTLLLAGLLLAFVLAGWGLSEFLDRRPNPILVTVVSPGDDPSPAPISPFPTGDGFTEVEVARARAVRMTVTDMPVAGAPPGSGVSVPSIDPDAVAAEEKELRAALDEWLAVPGRNLRIEQTWGSQEFKSLAAFTPKRVRVILRARLVPASSTKK